LVFGMGKIAVSLVATGPVTHYLRPGSYLIGRRAKVKTLLRKAQSRSIASLPLLCMVEGRRVEPSHRLEAGDVVTVLFLTGGG